MSHPAPDASTAPTPGVGGLPRLTITAADGARAEVYLHGAHVTSWVPAGGAEQLFVSARAEFSERAAIRGGIPVIFPQFGPGPLPRHGFARTAGWTVAAAGRAPDGAGEARLTLADSAATRAVWPFPFAAELRVRVRARSLAVSLGIENTGAGPLAFTGALHSYLAVPDVTGARLRGLRGVRYRDQAAGGVEREEAEEMVTVAGEVDRLYLDARSPLSLDDGAGRTVRIAAVGFPDVVVWNPWADKGDALADMAPGDYRRMLCVEAAAAGRPVTVAPGARWEGRQEVELG